MSLTAEMLAALAQTGWVVGTVCRLTLPAGLGAELGLPDDELRIAAAPFCSPIAGWFDKRVITFGKSLHALSDKNGNIRGWEIAITLSDLPETDAPPDRAIGPFGRAIKLADLVGAVAMVQGAAAGLDPEDWYTDRIGVLKGWSRSGQTGWILKIGPDDEALRRPCPRLKLTSDDWPDAFQPPKDQDQKVIGKYAPIALGRVDSAGLGDHGLRPTYLVEVATNRYLVSLGTIGATGFKVYVDGIATTDPLYTGPAATREVISVHGRTWTVVSFASALGTDKVVTVDCQGLDLGAYGTYTSPAAQLAWAYEHLVFASWNGGDLLPQTHTDPATFSILASAMGTREGAPGWLTQGLEVSGEEMTRRFCGQVQGVDIWWTELGTMAVNMLVPTAQDLDATPNVIIQGRDTTGPIDLLTPGSEEVLQAVSVTYLQGADARGLADLSLVHPRHLDAPPKPLVSQWSQGRVL